MQAAASPNLSLTLAQSVGQGPSPNMTPVLGGTSAFAQSGEVAGLMGGGGGGAIPVQTPPSLLQQQPPPGGGAGGIGGVSLLLCGAALQQPAVGQYTGSPGQPQPHNLQHAPPPPGGQNVPAASSSVPTAGARTSASSAAMPNLMTSSLLIAQQSQLTRGTMRAFGVFGSLVPGKDLMKPLIPESLHLSTPTVNSLFGIPIAVDGDEDR